MDRLGITTEWGLGSDYLMGTGYFNGEMKKF